MTVAGQSLSNPGSELGSHPEIQSLTQEDGDPGSRSGGGDGLGQHQVTGTQLPGKSREPPNPGC